MKIFNIKKLLRVAGFLTIGLICSCENSPERLPFYGNREPVEKIVNGKKTIDTIYATIPAFSFFNQDSIKINNHFFDGKIYVADFFFTTCPSICPIMHRNLMPVYKKFKGNKEVAFLSHTIDYRYDLPHVLKTYAKKLGVYGEQWQFVHGTRDSVYKLAGENYLVAVDDDSRDKGAYVHQGFLVLIDKHKRIRGTYDGTRADQAEQMSRDMDKLLLEE